MKRIHLAVIGLFFLMLLNSCANPAHGWGPTITYSNLASQESFDYATRVLENAKIPLQSIKVFQDQVKFTNDYLKDLPGLQGDFTIKNGATVDYDEELAWKLFIKVILPDDLNCRIAAWNLVKDRVTTIPLEGDIEPTEQSILDYYPHTGFSSGDKERFWSVYKGIAAGFINTKSGYAKIIQKEWTARGVAFTAGDVSLVSCFAYSSENKQLEAVHAGVMINAEDTILFIEKYNPKAPFQVSKFESENDLRYYLEQRLLKSFILQPIIMKNDALL